MLLRRKQVDALQGIAREIAHADNVCCRVELVELFRRHVRIFNKREATFLFFAHRDDDIHAAQLVCDDQVRGYAGFAKILIFVRRSHQCLAAAGRNLRCRDAGILVKVIVFEFEVVNCCAFCHLLDDGRYVFFGVLRENFGAVPLVLVTRGSCEDVENFALEVISHGEERL